MQVARLEHRRCWLPPVSCTIKALGAGQVPARAVPAREQRAAMCKHGRGTTFAPCSQLAHATPCVDYWVEADRIGQVIAVAAIARAINTWPLASSVSVCTSRGRGRFAAFRTPMLQGRSASTRKPPWAQLQQHANLLQANRGAMPIGSSTMRCWRRWCAHTKRFLGTRVSFQWLHRHAPPTSLSCRRHTRRGPFLGHGTNGQYRGAQRREFRWSD